MAAAKSRKAQIKPKAVKSAKTEKAVKTKRRGRTRSAGTGGDGPNFLRVGADGRLVLQSGSTGEISDIDPALRPQIEELLQKRQQAGIELSQLLAQNGLDVAPSVPVHFEED
jgi:hypothetical protein